MKEFHLTAHLTDEEYKYCKNNPHTISYFCDTHNIGPIRMRPGWVYRYSRTFNPDNFLKKSNIPRNIQYKQPEVSERLDQLDVPEGMRYQARGQRPATTLHLGQLKLFLSTFQFLLKYSHATHETHVIYPGSAPGNNIDLLTKLFPEVYWHLFDPRPFYPRLSKNSRVLTIEQDFFLDKHIKILKTQLAHKHTLLISDIRDCDDVTDESIDGNMRLQEDWVRQLRPSYAQLKFRLPRLGDEYEYLDGDVYLQMFAPSTSTETRLVVNGRPRGGSEPKRKVWSVDDYEGRMYYFNRVLRPSHYPSDNKHKCLDHCHDCVLFRELLDEYRRERLTDSLDHFIDVVIDMIPNVRQRTCRDYFATLKGLSRR